LAKSVPVPTLIRQTINTKDRRPAHNIGNCCTTPFSRKKFVVNFKMESIESFSNAEFVLK
jgi:hypothetical protein